MRFSLDNVSTDRTRKSSRYRVEFTSWPWHVILARAMHNRPGYCVTYNPRLRSSVSSDYFLDDRKDAIACNVSIVSLQDGPSYEALSYVWGDESVRAPILANGVLTTVTTNLESALRHLRLPDEARVMWVDALCIDQNDMSERNHQVSIMGEIYSCCSHCPYMARSGG